MDLDRVAVELRPRSGWEGVDLGVAMWQRWVRPISAASCFVVLPLGALLLVVLRRVDWTPLVDLGSGGAAYAALMWWLYAILPVALVLWFLTPLLQRITVHVLAHALFGDVPKLIETLRATPKLLGRNLLLGLVAHRLSRWRTLIQPIAQLEGLSGEERRNRQRQMAFQAGGVARITSLVAFVLHVSLAVAGVALLFTVLPSEILPDLGPLRDGDLTRFDAGWTTHAARAIWVLAYCVAGPLDAAVGFGQYISIRTRIEGWDLDVAFLRLRMRIEQAAKTLRAGAALVALAAFVFLARPASAQDTPVAPPAADGRVEDVSKRVLSSEEFGTAHEEKSWRLDFDWSPDMGDKTSFDWLGLLAPIVEVALWTALIVGLVSIFFVVAKRAGWIERAEPAPPEVERPTHLFGLDLRPESLPDDVPTAALALWRRGDAVGALGLLYRGAISRLIQRDGLALESSDTEYDCLRRARRLSNTERVDYFKDVTRAWQTCAYSTARPTTEAVERLCQDWSQRFERAAA